METTILEHFITIADTKSFTKASEILHLSQPALSRQIQNLEKELQTKLFKRKSHEVVLTEAGRAFRESAIYILNVIEKSKNQLKKIVKKDFEDISIGGGSSEIHHFLVDFIKEMKQIAPNLRFHIFSGTNEDISTLVKKGQLDIAFIYYTFENENLASLKIPFPLRLGLLVNKNEEIGTEYFDKSILLEHPIIIYENPLSENLDNHFKYFTDYSKDQLNIIGAANNIRDLELYVTSNLGWALIDDDTAKESSDQVKFIPIMPEIFLQQKLVWNIENLSPYKKIVLEKLIEEIIEKLF